MSYGVSSIYRQRSGCNRVKHKCRKGAIHGPTVITPKQPPAKPKRKNLLKAAHAVRQGIPATGKNPIQA
jgi:hypothetical protein